MSTSYKTAVAALLALSLPLSAGAQVRQQHAAKVALTGSAADLIGPPLSVGLVPPLDASQTATGTFDPHRLGGGTPTGSTVLLGSGTWAGMTPGGNAIASTGSLLMGDSAGNAQAVPSSANLYRVLRARLDSVQASQAQPANLLAASNLAGGTINADGTITVPANGSVQWGVLVAPSDVANTPLYGYVVATTDTPYGALCLHANYGADHASTDSTVAPGVYRSQFTNITGVYAYNVFLRNSTASAITVFYPVVATQDTGLALLASHADYTPVALPPVADLDFTRFSDADRSARYQFEKLTTLAADSVNGDDQGGDTTLYKPTRTLAEWAAKSRLVTNGSVLGLYRGGAFSESLPLPNSSTTHGIIVQDVALGSVKPLPIISALDSAPGPFTSNGDGTYTYIWTPTETLDNGGYANVYMVEINTATEAITPIASRRRMVDSSNVSGTPGSVLVSALSGGRWQARLHPSDGLAPGSGSYRYEVVSRVQPANWGSFAANAGDGAMSGLMLVGGNSGYGSLSGPRGFVGDRLVFLHASTHNAVIGGGSLQRSVFYEAGDLANGHGPSIQLAWYADTGTGLRWDTRHCLFYSNVGDRYANGLISHTGGGTSFDRGDLSDCAFLGARWSTGVLAGTAIDYVNVAAGSVNRVYVQGVRDALGNNMPLAAEVKNSVFRGVHRALVGENFHDNIVQSVNGGDPNDANNRNPNACVFQQSGASATNNLFWAHTDTATGIAGDDQVSGISAGYTNCTCARNIFVLDPANTTTPPTYAGPAPAGTVIDYNLVINLSKAGFNAQGPNGGYFSWAAYLAGYPAQDQHSLYIDLSADPRGLQAVFADPANGDFRWAQTDVARRCAAFCKANNVGPAAVTSRWPVVPTVDEAVRLISTL